MNRLKKHHSSIQLLQKAPPKIQKHILKNSSKELIRCICDCCLNLLKCNLKINSTQKKKLKPYKNSVRQLADRNISLTKKRKVIQSGGFLSALLGVLAPAIGGLISSLSK